MKLSKIKSILGLLLVAPSVFAQELMDSIPLSVSFEEEIVVTGQYAPTDIQTSILPIRVITKETIEKRGATNLTEIFQQEANIRIQQDAVLGTSMTLNGLGGQYIKILLDGVPLIGRNDGNLDLDRIQIQDIERIEIIENAMSVAYGTNALGGTINIITKKQQKETWGARIMTQVQSNQQYNVSGTIGGKWANFAADVTYNFSHFSGFSTDTLRSQTWNPKQQHSLVARLYYTIPKSSIKLAYQFNYLNEKIDDKGLAKLNAFPILSYAKDYEFVTLTQDHSLAALGYLDKKKHYYLDILLSFNDYQRQKNAYFRSLNENPSPDTLDKKDSDTTTFQAWNTRLILASQYHQKIDFQAGIDIRYDYTTGNRIYQQQAQLGDFALFANLRYKPFEKLLLDGGVRVAYNTLAKALVTYSVGLKWTMLQGMSLRCSYARGIRTPSLKELYLNFVDVNHYIKGNSDLKPEYAHNIRLGWMYSKAYLGEHLVNWEWSGFYNFIEQQIALYTYNTDSLGNYIIDHQATSTKYAYFNLKEYQNWGLNTTFKYQWKGLVIRLGATLIGHYNSLNKNYEAQVKPFQYTLEFTQEISYHLQKIDLAFSLFRRDYDQQISYIATTNPITKELSIQQNIIDGYGLMDVTITKGFFNKGLQIAVGLKNLLDVKNINQSGSSGTHSSGGGSLSVGMGRIFFVRLICQPFNIKIKPKGGK